MPTPSIDDARLAEIDRLAEREVAEAGVPGLAIALTGPEGPWPCGPTGWPTSRPDARSSRRRSSRSARSARRSRRSPSSSWPRRADSTSMRRSSTSCPGSRSRSSAGRSRSTTSSATPPASPLGIDGTPEAAFQVWSLRGRRPGSAPGDRFHYSNVGYKALGLVIEAVEGRPYPEVVRSRILEPLGMTATEPAITHDVRSRLAVGYDYLHDDRIGYPGRPIVPATWLETATADGSIASTAGDMAAFARMLLRRGEGPAGRLVSEASFARHGRAARADAARQQVRLRAGHASDRRADAARSRRRDGRLPVGAPGGSGGGRSRPSSSRTAPWAIR